MGYKRSQLATGAFLSVPQTSDVLLLSTLTGLRTLNVGPIIAAGSSAEVQAGTNSDVDYAAENDGNFNDSDLTSFTSDADHTEEAEIEQSLDFTQHSEYESSLPASLAKATLVGAQLRSQDTDTKNLDEGEVSSSDKTILDSPNANTEGGVSRNPKSPLAGCVWGSAGCNKGKWNAATNSGTSINSSAVDEPEENDLDTTTTSLFAGSATAKIKAHVKEARGGASSSRRTPLASTRHTNRRNSGENSRNLGEGAGEVHDHSDDNAHKPPQGFQLSARVVTSPSDGLSYFLDVPEDPNALEINNWMMNIPYTYVECGPTVESTTESFLLEDMVVRHFPHGADMGHWMNLAGGITIETKSEKGGTESEGEMYINDNRDGHPKLLVALSPIEITVSGNGEETRSFHPGEVVLMEDILGKGHKMRAARGNLDETHLKRPGQDLKVLMVSLPHSVHFPLSDWDDHSRHQRATSKSSSSTNSMQTNASSESPSPSSYSGAKHSIFGLAPKYHSRGRLNNYKDYRTARFLLDDTKPCPLEYDSAYSSLFTTPHHQRRSRRRRRRNHQRGESAFSSEYPPPPGHSMYDDESILFRFLPSLRRTMLFGIGLSLTSSFVYCVQLLYPPLLALLGGAAFVMGGALINVLGTRWSYRQWLAVWEEEWRWRREMKRHREAERERKNVNAGDADADTFTFDETNNLIFSEEETVEGSA